MCNEATVNLHPLLWQVLQGNLYQSWISKYFLTPTDNYNFRNNYIRQKAETMDLCHITGSLHRRAENGLNKVSLETFPHTHRQLILLITTLVDVCQCWCLLMFVCSLLPRHFPCCKTWWIKNLNSARSSLITGPSRNRLQTVNYLP